MNRDITGDLNLEQGWAIGEESFHHIHNLLMSIKPRHIIEFGSGHSSVRLALAFPEANILSFESQENCALNTQQLIAKFAPHAKITIRLQPLAKYWFGGGRYLTYRNIVSEEQIDAVIIDGPPGITRRGREACLYAIYEKLRVGGVVILDDYIRLGEKQIVRNWLMVFRDSFEVNIITSGHHLAVLRKIKQTIPNWRSPGRIIDNWTILLSEILRMLLPRGVIARSKQILRPIKSLLLRKD